MSPIVNGNGISGIFQKTQFSTNYSPVNSSYITNQPFEKATSDRIASDLTQHYHLKPMTYSFGQEY